MLRYPYLQIEPEEKTQAELFAEVNEDIADRFRQGQHEYENFTQTLQDVRDAFARVTRRIHSDLETADKTRKISQAQTRRLETLRSITKKNDAELSVIPRIDAEDIKTVEASKTVPRSVAKRLNKFLSKTLQIEDAELTIARDTRFPSLFKSRFLSFAAKVPLIFHYLLIESSEALELKRFGTTLDQADALNEELNNGQNDVEGRHLRNHIIIYSDIIGAEKDGITLSNDVLAAKGTLKSAFDEVSNELAEAVELSVLVGRFDGEADYTLKRENSVNVEAFILNTRNKVKKAIEDGDCSQDLEARGQAFYQRTKPSPAFKAA